MEFHYYDGETVRVGDRVRTGCGRSGVVEKIAFPGTELARMFQSPHGGVLIKENWGQTCSPLFMKPPDGQAWEDLELIERGPSKRDGGETQ